MVDPKAALLHGRRGKEMVGKNSKVGASKNLFLGTLIKNTHQKKSVT